MRGKEGMGGKGTCKFSTNRNVISGRVCVWGGGIRFAGTVKKILRLAVMTVGELLK